MIFQNCLRFHSPDYYVYKFRNTTRSIYAKYHYKSCYYLYFFKNYHINWTRAFFKSVPNLVRWLIFNVNVLDVRTWIVTDQFWLIRPHFSFILQALVVQRLDSAIHRIKLYSVDNTIGFPNTYPLDGDLSGGQRYPTFEQPGPDLPLWVALAALRATYMGGRKAIIRGRLLCYTFPSKVGDYLRRGY